MQQQPASAQRAADGWGQYGMNTPHPSPRNFISGATLATAAVTMSLSFVKSTGAWWYSISEETPLFFEFSLCLSRACLGKLTHNEYKWRKKVAFLHH
jgi:hypothetical protein